MLLAKKKNMTQVFADDNKVVPVTILDFSECAVIKGQKKSGTFVGIGKKRHASKAEVGKYGEGNVPEFAAPTSEEVSEIEMLNPGDTVNLYAYSKGKGFAGVVRMWKFKGGKRTHGQSDRQRHPGSVGAGTTPGRVFKGKRMGRLKGQEKVTVRGVKVVSVDADNKLICVKGSIPGTYDSIVVITRK